MFNSLRFILSVQCFYRNDGSCMSHRIDVKCSGYWSGKCIWTYMSAKVQLFGILSNSEFCFGTSGLFLVNFFQACFSALYSCTSLHFLLGAAHYNSSPLVVGHSASLLCLHSVPTSLVDISTPASEVKQSAICLLNPPTSPPQLISRPSGVTLSDSFVPRYCISA